MEIRPYKSQVRSVPVTSADQAAPDLSKGAKLQVYGNLVEGAGKVAADAYDMFAAQRQKDLNVALKATQQDIDAGFSESMAELQRYLDEQSKNPSQVFYQQDKDVDEVYNYLTQKIYAEKIDTIKNPKQRALAEEYYNNSKLAFGAAVSDATIQHKNKAAAYVYGSDVASQINLGIAGDEKAEENALLMISGDLGAMADRGIITREELPQKYEEAKRQIKLGRAKNEIDRLDYATGQEFINKAGMDDATRKAAQTYFKDKWDRESNILNQQQGEAYNEWIDAIAGGTATREGILSDDRLKGRQELGIHDHAKALIAYLDNQDKAEKDRRRTDRYNYFLNMINDGGYDPEDMRKKILADSYLDPRQDKEHLLAIIGAGGGRGSSGGSARMMDDYTDHMSEFLDFATDKYTTPQYKKSMLLDFCTLYNVPPEKMSTLNSYIEKAFVDPRITAMTDTIQEKIKYYKGKGDVKTVSDLEEAASSLFRTISEDVYETDKMGKRVERAKPEVDKIIDDAVNVAALLVKEKSLLSDLSELSYSGNPVKFDLKVDKVKEGKEYRNEYGYTMDIDDQFFTLKSIVPNATQFKYTDEGQHALAQLAIAEKAAIGEAAGLNISRYEQVVWQGKSYYRDPNNKSHYYFIDLNGKGNWNVFEHTKGGIENSEIVTPYIIKRERYQYEEDHRKLTNKEAYETADPDSSYRRLGMAQYEYERNGGAE